MASESLCRCGLPRSVQAMSVLFTCDVCGEQTTSNGPYIPLKAATEQAKAALPLHRSARRCSHGMFAGACVVRSCEHFDGITNAEDATRLRRGKSHGGRTRDREQRARRVLRSRKDGAS